MISELSGAAEDITPRIEDKSNWSTDGCLARRTAIGGTKGTIVTCNFNDSFIDS